MNLRAETVVIERRPIQGTTVCDTVRETRVNVGEQKAQARWPRAGIKAELDAEFQAAAAGGR